MAGIMQLAAGRPATASPTALGAPPARPPHWLTTMRLTLVTVLSVYLVLYHIYIGIYGPPTNAIFLPVHLLIALTLVFLLNPAGVGSRLRPVPRLPGRAPGAGTDGPRARVGAAAWRAICQTARARSRGRRSAARAMR